MITLAALRDYRMISVSQHVIRALVVCFVPTPSFSPCSWRDRLPMPDSLDSQDPPLNYVMHLPRGLPNWLIDHHRTTAHSGGRRWSPPGWVSGLRDPTGCGHGLRRGRKQRSLGPVTSMAGVRSRTSSIWSGHRHDTAPSNMEVKGTRIFFQVRVAVVWVIVTMIQVTPFPWHHYDRRFSFKAEPKRYTCTYNTKLLQLII